MHLNLIWDLESEKPTLGGLLTLVAEISLLEKHDNVESVSLQCLVPSWSSGTIERLRLALARHLNSEALEDLVLVRPADAIRPRSRLICGYPTKENAYDLTAIQWLYSEGFGKPKLPWTVETEDKMTNLRRSLPEKLLALHLRRTNEGLQTVSDADGKVWASGLELARRRMGFEVVLIGDDPLDSAFRLSGGFIHAKELGLDLGEQLSFVGHCDAFMGTASGVATSAIFSETPYAVFKHPEHHAKQMSAELGESSTFSFASKRQSVHRTIPTPTSIASEALRLLSVA